MSRTELGPSRRTAPWTIDELALIERERQRWLAVGMSTERANVPALQAVWAALYRRAGRKPVFCWVVPGPMAALAAIAIWRRDGLGAALHAAPDDSLGTALHASLYASLNDSLHASLGASLVATPSTMSLASLRPRPVIALTTLITWIF